MKKSIGLLLAVPFVLAGCIFVTKKGDACCKGGSCKDSAACSKDMKMDCCEKNGAAMKCCAPKDGKPCCSEMGKACSCACCKPA